MNRFFYFIFIIFYLNGNFAYASLKISDLTLNDPSFEKCLKAHAKKHQWQTVEQVTSLKCNNMNIKNVDGIAALSKLTSLSLYKNKLQQVDLKALKNIEELNISNNQLTTINVTGLTKLTSLYLFKNKLKYIDFSGLHQLKKLRITNNVLTKIDISPLLSLEKAYFFDNKLEDMILKGLPKLTFIELRQNPMPDEVYDRYDAIEGITIIHDGNADDWK